MKTDTNGKKILLVDDDPFILKLMSKALGNQGFECRSAFSVAAAMEQFKEFTPDLILSDYEMPEINGFQFREKIISMPGLANIPFMFLTSYTGEDFMMQGLNLQAVDYISKITPIPIIVTKINNLLATVEERHLRALQELTSAAAALNLKSVPDKVPGISGFEIDFFYRTFQNYPGGDFIDFIAVDKRYTYVVLGDVMGKKWGAWFFSISFLSYVRAAIRLCVYEGEFSTANILRKINNVIFDDPVLSDILSTLSLILIDNEENSITYSGAGDIPLIHYEHASAKASPVQSGGLLLGLFNDGVYDEKKIMLKQGDTVIALTDGAIDFEDQGIKRSNYNLFLSEIEETLKADNSYTALENCMIKKYKSFTQVDDCSLIFIKAK